MRRLCSMALLVLLNPACTTTSTPVSVFHRFEELDISREFSSHTIGTKSFVLNVIGLDEYDSIHEPSLTSAQATQLLIEDFYRFRPELKLLEPRFSAQEQKTLQKILNRFGEQQEFPAEGYIFLQKPSLANSWFLIADVERMDTRKNVTEEDIKDNEGKRVNTKYSFIHARSLQIRYFIYDPAARHLVFSGLVRSSTEAIHDRVGGGDEGDYPEAPGLGKSLNQNFEKFLHALPAIQGT